MDDASESRFLGVELNTLARPPGLTAACASAVGAVTLLRRPEASSCATDVTEEVESRLPDESLRSRGALDVSAGPNPASACVVDSRHRIFSLYTSRHCMRTVTSWVTVEDDSSSVGC